MKNQDYTRVTNREYSEKSQIELKQGDAAIVTRADGSLCLHIPGSLEEVSIGHSNAMLMALVLSGTPMAEPIYRKLCEVQGASLDLADVDVEGLPN